MKVVTGEELCKHPGEGRVRGCRWSHGRGKGQWGGRGCVFPEESPTRGLMGQRERCWVLLFEAGNN